MQSLNYEIFQTKANFPLGKKEDFYDCKSDGSFKKCKLVLLFKFRIHAELTSKHDTTVKLKKCYATNHMYFTSIYFN